MFVDLSISTGNGIEPFEAGLPFLGNVWYLLIVDVLKLDWREMCMDWRKVRAIRVDGGGRVSLRTGTLLPAILSGFKSGWLSGMFVIERRVCMNLSIRYL